MTRIAFAIATWGGCGLFPVGPGTVGSLAALAIAWLLSAYAGWGPLHFLALTAAATPAAIWASGVTARAEGREDPGKVVVDEVVGQWLTLAGAATLTDPTMWVAAFVLFRFFDIRKPWPVRRFEELPGGVGIVADDLAAGAWAAALLCLARYVNL